MKDCVNCDDRKNMDCEKYGKPCIVKESPYIAGVVSSYRFEPLDECNGANKCE